MRLRLPCAFLALLIVLPALAQTDKPKPPTDISKSLQDILSRTLEKPPTDGSSLSTTFTPTEGLLFLKPMLSKMSLTSAQEKQFREYVAQLIKMVETVYQTNDLPKHDVGVAFGGLLEICYEFNTGTFNPNASSPSDKKKTLAV